MPQHDVTVQLHVQIKINNLIKSYATHQSYQGCPRVSSKIGLSYLAAKFHISLKHQKK